MWNCIDYFRQDPENDTLTGGTSIHSKCIIWEYTPSPFPPGTTHLRLTTLQWVISQQWGLTGMATWHTDHKQLSLSIIWPRTTYHQIFVVEHMCTCVKPWNWTPIESKRSGGFSYVLLRREIHGLISLISFEIGWLIDKSINNSRTECKMKNHAFLHHNLLAKSTAWSHKLYTKSVHIMWSHRDSVNFQKSPHISGIFSSSLLLLLSVQKICTFMGFPLESCTLRLRKSVSWFTLGW